MERGFFTAAELRPCYAPPNLKLVMPGNRVMLRFGGSEMIVSDVDQLGQAVCSGWEMGCCAPSHSISGCLTLLGEK